MYIILIIQHTFIYEIVYPQMHSNYIFYQLTVYQTVYGNRIKDDLLHHCVHDFGMRCIDSSLARCWPSLQRLANIAPT